MPSADLDRLHVLEWIVEQQEADILAMRAEIISLHERVGSLEKIRRLLFRVWRVFWNEPAKYTLAILLFISWLSGKMEIGQVVKALQEHGGGP